MSNLDTFFDQLGDNAYFSGDDACERVDYLLTRIGDKRLEVVNRLMSGIKAFGGRIGFISDEDYPDGASDEDNPFSDAGVTANGIFYEIDHWLYLRVNMMKSWKALETVLAHEAVHFLQSITYTGTRTEEDSGMTLCMDRIWAYDAEKYGAWVADLADEEVPPFEIEAYIEMDRPRGVACSLEYLKSRPSLWAGTYYCPVEADS